MKELRQRHKELSFLERIVRESAGGEDRHTLLRRIIQETTEATDTQVCSLYLLSDDGKTLTLTATNGLDATAVGTLKLAMGEGVTGWVASHQQPLAVPDVNVDPRWVRIHDVDQDHFTSILSVPVASRTRLIGVINVQTVERHDFSTTEEEFLLALAALVAGIVEMSSAASRLKEGLTAPLSSLRELARHLNGSDRERALAIERDLIFLQGP